MRKMSLTEVRSNLFELNCRKELLDYPPFWCYRSKSSLGISNHSDSCDSYMFIEVEYDFRNEKVRGINFVIKAYSKQALYEESAFKNKKEQKGIINAIRELFPSTDINFMAVIEES